MIDATHATNLASWVPGADGHPSYPIQNLPLCVFSVDSDDPRGGVAIGDHILDLKALAATDLLAGRERVLVQIAAASDLKGYFALDAADRARFRQCVSSILSAKASKAAAMRDALLVEQDDVTFHLPTQVRSFSDFSNSLAHVYNAGSILNPAMPVFPSFKHLPVGFSGKGNTVRVSGHPVVRPNGQLAPLGSKEPREFGPTRELDFELEMAFWIGAGNRLGEPIPIAEAGRHIVGFGLLNDWSARDMQFWESLPLGPFLSKNFITTVSPFVVTAEALAPFRCAPSARQADDPEPFAYLIDAEDQAGGALDINTEVYLSSDVMRERGLPPARIVRSSTTGLYWTPAQLVAHHTSNGSCIEPGDLFGSGTISTWDEGGKACLLEITEVGQRQITLPSGETRTYLEDGDEVTLEAYCERPGFARISFGKAVGQVVANPGGAGLAGTGASAEQDNQEIKGIWNKHV